ncbi:MAG: SMC-Scp complex subunit ScpB [Candidatus Omnitrophica bacterium]|nr:SMC-Scp complex subunit ScpB [Candidatus Omnitrophota bacterium]
MNELRYAVEALLFASERPLSVKEMGEAFGEEADEKALEAGLHELKNEYESQGRGFKLVEIAGGFQLVSDPRFASTLKRFYQAREKKRLTQASLETLSIVAYKQPVSRADVEFIRGVQVDGALKTLLERNLIRIAGRKDVPGRPLLYGTTREFLEYFGLKGLEELPPLKEFTEAPLEQAKQEES